MPGKHKDGKHKPKGDKGRKGEKSSKKGQEKGKKDRDRKEKDDVGESSHAEGGNIDHIDPEKPLSKKEKRRLKKEEKIEKKEKKETSNDSTQSTGSPNESNEKTNVALRQTSTNSESVCDVPLSSREDNSDQHPTIDDSATSGDTSSNCDKQSTNQHRQQGPDDDKLKAKGASNKGSTAKSSDAKSKKVLIQHKKSFFKYTIVIYIINTH
jgi:hypothetical protein